MQNLINIGQTLSRLEMKHIVAGGDDEDEGSGTGCYYCFTQCQEATTSAHTGMTSCSSGAFERCNLSGTRCNGGED